MGLRVDIPRLEQNFTVSKSNGITVTQIFLTLIIVAYSLSDTTLYQRYVLLDGVHIFSVLVFLTLWNHLRALFVGQTKREVCFVRSCCWERNIHLNYRLLSTSNRTLHTRPATERWEHTEKKSDGLQEWAVPEDHKW